VVAEDVRRLKTLEAWASAVTAFVGGMSLADWGLVASLLVGIAALLYARRAARVSEEELELAKEQATLRPKLEMSLRDVVFHPRPENPGSPYEHVAVVFNITNTGRSAANNIRCEVDFKEEDLVPDDMYGANHDFFEHHIGPSEERVHQVNAAVHAYGPTEAHYICVCDEVGKSEGTVTVEVPKKEATDTK
jgi:hypothetical protein